MFTTRYPSIPLIVVSLLLAISIAGCSAQAVTTPAMSIEPSASQHAPDVHPTTTLDIASQRAAGTQAAATAAALVAAHAELTGTAAAIGTATAGPALAESNAPNGWNLILYEPFADNTHKWPEGADDGNPSVYQQREVIGSQYLVNSSASQDFSSYFFPQMPNVLDFYVTVDARLLSGELTSEYGLVAGLNPQTGDYYVFLIDERGLWAISLHKDGSWFPIISGRSSQILSGGNHLAVLCQQNNYTFYVNNQPIARITDDQLSAPGKIGIFVEGGAPGTESSIAFDNFTVLTP